MPVGNYTITADSIPDLDEWGYDDFWGCNHWMDWHKKNRATYGLEVANQKFGDYWNQQGFGASPVDCLTFNNEFMNYVARVPGLYDIAWGNVYLKPILQPVGAAGSAIGGASRGVANVGRALKWIVPAAAGLTLAGLATWGVIKIVKEYKK